MSIDRDELNSLKATVEQLKVDDRTGWRKCDAHDSLYLSCDDESCRYIWQLEEHALQLQQSLAEAREQNVFEQVFAGKLEEFGTVNRLIEEYSAAKMKLRDSESHLNDLKRAMDLKKADTLGAVLKHWHDMVASRDHYKEQADRQALEKHEVWKMLEETRAELSRAKETIEQANLIISKRCQ